LQGVAGDGSVGLPLEEMDLAILAQQFTPRPRPGNRPRWVMQGTLGLADGPPMVITAR